MSEYNPVKIYDNRVREFSRIERYLKKKGFRLGMVKLISLIGTGIFFLNQIDHSNPLNWILIGGFLLILIGGSWRHEIIIKDLKFYQSKILLNKRELDYLKYNYSGDWDHGENFKDVNHQYTSDLDIFENHGLFQYSNRACTSLGKKTLATWLSNPAKIKEINQRQEAIGEIIPDIDIRQDVAVHGQRIADSNEFKERFFQFLKEPDWLLKKKILLIIIGLLPILTILSVVAIAFGVPFYICFFLFFIQLLINLFYQKRVSKLYQVISRGFKILKAYSKILARIEQGKFSKTLLRGCLINLQVKEQNASVYIKKLSNLLEWFDVRNGMIHFFVNNIFFWDLFCVFKIEKWKGKTGKYIFKWFEVIGIFEALSSGATMMFNNPDWVFPRVFGDQKNLVGDQVGHPLIPPRERVCNDFKLEKKEKIIVITGPNMAGKSTFLRTIGVNMVLAFAGFGVSAKRMSLSPFNLITSMKSSDSLDKHLSLFYAELQRLKKILEGIKRKETVFFLVDEMLKGTNALDRQKGAYALLKQLMKTNVKGIVATHDLKLTNLQKSHPGEVQNYFFDSYLKKDKLIFDYKLKKGVCKSFNALILMRKMGIEV